MTYREKFHYSAILIKTSNISICIIHSYKKTTKYIYQYRPFYFYWKNIPKTIVVLCT